LLSGRFAVFPGMPFRGPATSAASGEEPRHRAVARYLWPPVRAGSIPARLSLSPGVTKNCLWQLIVCDSFCDGKAIGQGGRYVRLQGLIDQRGVFHGVRPVAFEWGTSMILCTIAKKKLADRPPMRTPVIPSIGASIRHGVGSTRSP
jgi:hypothetical protein